MAIEYDHTAERLARIDALVARARRTADAWMRQNTEFRGPGVRCSSVAAGREVSSRRIAELLKGLERITWETQQIRDDREEQLRRRA